MVLYAILCPADGAMFASLENLSRFTFGNYNSQSCVYGFGRQQTTGEQMQ